MVRTSSGSGLSVSPRMPGSGRAADRNFATWPDESPVEARKASSTSIDVPGRYHVSGAFIRPQSAATYSSGGETTTGVTDSAPHGPEDAAVLDDDDDGVTTDGTDPYERRI